MIRESATTTLTSETQASALGLKREGEESRRRRVKSTVVDARTTESLNYKRIRNL